MIHFVVAVGAPALVARLAPRLAPAVEASRFVVGPVRQERAPAGTWAVAAVEAPDPLAARRLVTDGDDLLVLNGPALARPSRQAQVAGEALGAFRTGGSEAVGDALGGTWNVVAWTPARGLRAFTDLSGLYPLYWQQVEGAVLVTNRPSTVAAVQGHASWDVGALAWLLNQNRLHGAAMPVEGVVHLRSDDELRLPPGRSVAEVAPVPRDLWPGPDSDPGRDDLTPGEWDAVTEELVESVRPLGSLDGPVDLMLTGGKDSRLVLALAKAAGILGDVRVITSGGADSPEVRAASVVARAAGCTHHHADGVAGRVLTTYRAPSDPTSRPRRAAVAAPSPDGPSALGPPPGAGPAGEPGAAIEAGDAVSSGEAGPVEEADASDAPALTGPVAPAAADAPPPTPATGVGRGAAAPATDHRPSTGTARAGAGGAGPWFEDMDEVWRRLRQSVHRYDGTLCLWDGVTGPLGGRPRIQIKGFGGELYRTHQYIDGSPFSSARRSLRLLRFEQTPDPLGLLPPEVLAAQRAWLREFARDAGRRARFDLAPDLLRATYVQGHWNGPMAQFTPGLVQVNPLLTPIGVRANARLNGPTRHRERFHHEVMRRAAPELVDVPFLQNRWQRSLTSQDRMVARGAGRLSTERLVFERYLATDRFRNRLRLAALTPGLPIRQERLRAAGRSARPTPSRLLKTWQWRFLATQSEAMVDLFERAGRDTALPAICDMDRLLVLGRGSAEVTDSLDARSIMSAVSISLTLLGESEPVVDEPLA